MPAVEAGEIFAQKKPEIRGAGAHHKHNDHVAFEARGEQSVPVIRADRTHEKTQTGKKGGQQTVGCSAISNPLPDQTHEVG